ncbi:hypothetical protein [uncultured Rubinisphaera sp.]|uniref:hypothetical protein n=1 Tax=uncultured Rubinisphaera sp. TaxID=1678686 RepID=UPI0030DCF3EC
MARGFTQYSYIDDELPDEWPIHSAHLDYILDDGTRLNVNQADYYCPNCNHFVVGERIETVSALEQEINAGWPRKILSGRRSRKILLV